MRVRTVILSLLILSSTVFARTPNPDTIMVYFVPEDASDPNSPTVMTVRLELETVATGNGYTDYTITKAVFTEIDSSGQATTVWERDWPHLGGGNMYFRDYDNQGDAPPIEDNAISSSPLISNLVIDDTGINYDESSGVARFIEIATLADSPIEIKPVDPADPSYPD